MATIETELTSAEASDGAGETLRKYGIVMSTVSTHLCPLSALASASH